MVPELVSVEKVKILNFYIVKLWEKLPKWPNFGLNILAWQLFGPRNFYGLNLLSLFDFLLCPKHVTNSILRAKIYFSSWQFSFFLILVPEKVRSSSLVIKKLPTFREGFAFA